MARPATKQLGIVGILREVLAIPLRNPGLISSVLLLLLPWNLLLAFPKLLPRLGAVNVAPLVDRLLRRLQELPQGESPGVLEYYGEPPAVARRYEELTVDITPVTYVVAELTALAMVYLSAVACKGKSATLGALWSKVRRSWKQVADSSFYVQLFNLAYACLFLVPAALTAVFSLPSWAFLLLLLAFFSMIFFTVVFSLYLGIVCRLCLVVSAVEEDKCGVAALAKAFSLTRRRKLQGIVLVLLCHALSRLAPRSYAVTGGEKQTEEIAAWAVVVWRFAGVLVDLSLRLLGWLLWTVYYYECNKSRGLMVKEDMVGEGRSLLPMSGCANDDVDEQKIP